MLQFTKNNKETKQPYIIIILIGLLTSFIQTPSFGQKEKEFVDFPSPNASNLGLYGDIPVGHYTGIPKIDIPIYNLEAKDINVPISLSYHSAAVKVDNHPSWVGLGWSLQAGGAITRVQHGLMDELVTSGIFNFGFYHTYSNIIMGFSLDI